MPITQRSGHFYLLRKEVIQMRCESCTRKFGRKEIVSGIRFGTVDFAANVFIPSRGLFVAKGGYKHFTMLVAVVN